MVSAGVRDAFEAMTIAGGGDPAALAIGLRRDVTGLGLRALAAKTLHVAVVAPERLMEVYDNAAGGWLSKPVLSTRPPRQIGQRLELSPAFWDAFWALVELPAEARDKVAFAAAMARLAGLLPEALNARVAEATFDFPGVREAAANGLPGRFELRDLKGCPAGSLGGEFYRRAVRRASELEILDREALGLDHLPPPLDYVNTRILQCHTLWRLAAGYGDTEADDVALAAFQMGQFGHQFSALLVALVLAMAALQRPPGAGLLLDLVFSGWMHGRDSPPLLGVRWETIWRLRTSEARARLGLRPRDARAAAQSAAALQQAWLPKAG